MSVMYCKSVCVCGGVVPCSYLYNSQQSFFRAPHHLHGLLTTSEQRKQVKFIQFLFHQRVPEGITNQNVLQTSSAR